MNNIFRGLIAGYGAKQVGGGCFGTIIVFILIWVALGQCSFSSRAVPAPETYPADRRVHIELPKPFNETSVGNSETEVVFEKTIILNLDSINLEEKVTRVDASIFPSRKIYRALYPISFS
ncbi:MAG: hypothetical protein WD824_17505 [Cyclobacteriaceae bacterium]